MSIVGDLWSFAGYLVPFVFVLSIVVFFHELGHFLVGRWCGVKVDAFSIGFGPEIFVFVDRKQTRWRIAALPLGGYVKFHGDANGASLPDPAATAAMSADERAVSFSAQKVWKRALIVVAGPVANFILAIAIFSGVFFFYGRSVTAPRIASVQQGEAAAAAGFQPGDLIVSIDGQPITSWEDMQRVVEVSSNVPLTFVVRRGDSNQTIVATPRARVIETPFGKNKTGLLGVVASQNPDDWHVERYSLADSIKSGAAETWFFVARTGEFVGGIFQGRESADQISGPMGIAKVSGEAAKIGFSALLWLAAVLSVSIGLINLVPVPLLDGGHLLYYAVEALRGRPMSERAQEFGFRLGLGLVVALMLFATFNDIVHLARG
ncbi:MAG TPA: RIP metalloprotease RseP [Beijerinckiaceae bacterium]|jgi:regulator of sigma E protease|nr:RIP metalloprotease RseP [Beijerinckiaceae bacterium]